MAGLILKITVKKIRGKKAHYKNRRTWTARMWAAWLEGELQKRLPMPSPWELTNVEVAWVFD